MRQEAKKDCQEGESNCLLPLSTGNEIERTQLRGLVKASWKEIHVYQLEFKPLAFDYVEFLAFSNQD